MAIRVLLADDDSLILEALEIILNKDDNFHIVQTAKNGRDAVKICKNNQVDVAVLDIRMPIVNGVDAAAEISSNSKTKILILTTFKEDELIKKAVRNGANGYILKGSSGDEIKKAISLVHKGHTVFQEEVFSSLSKAEQHNKGDLSMLTQREIDVVKYIAEGFSNKEIAEHIFLSEGTVKNYITSIMAKLYLKQRTQIAIYYLTGKINPKEY